MLDMDLFPPTRIVSGTTVAFSRAFSDYPATSGWAYSFILAGPKTLTKAGIPASDSFELTLSATDTAALTPGAYRYAERVSKDGEVYEVGTGMLTVTADLAAATDGSTVSHAERTLAVLEAAIEGRMTSDMQSYQIAGRAVAKIPISELTRLRGVYAGIVWQQRNPSSLGQPVEVSFPGPYFPSAGIFPKAPGG